MSFLNPVLAGVLADISVIGNFYLRFGKSFSEEIEGSSIKKPIAFEYRLRL